MTYAARASIAAAAPDAEREGRVARRLSPSPFLAGPLRALGYDSRELWAWDTYESAVLAFARIAVCSLFGEVLLVPAVLAAFLLAVTATGDT